MIPSFQRLNTSEASPVRQLVEVKEYEPTGKAALMQGYYGRISIGFERKERKCFHRRGYTQDGLKRRPKDLMSDKYRSVLLALEAVEPNTNTQYRISLLSSRDQSVVVENRPPI